MENIAEKDVLSQMTITIEQLDNNNKILNFQVRNLIATNLILMVQGGRSINTVGKQQQATTMKPILKQQCNVGLTDSKL